MSTSTLALPSDAASVISNFSFGEHLFIFGSTIAAGLFGYAVSQPRGLKGAGAFINGFTAGTGAFCVCYVTSYTRIMEARIQALKKRRV